MTKAIRDVAAIIAVVLPVAALSQTPPDETTKTVRITGRVVNEAGDPDVYDAVVITRIEDGFLLPDRTINVAADGSFTFDGRPGNKYRLFLRDYALKAPVVVEAADGSNVRVGSMIAAPRCALRLSIMLQRPRIEGGDLKADQIIIERQAFIKGQSWNIDTLQSFSDQEIKSSQVVRLDADSAFALQTCRLPGPPVLQNVFSVWGHKMKTIRVMRYDPELTPSRIRHEVQKTWLGILMPLMDSPEPTIWNIEALVEYEDGRQATMLMDGRHVEVKDRDGRCSFRRLWDAMQ